MTDSKGGLGKGLSALFVKTDNEKNEKTFKEEQNKIPPETGEIELDLIIFNPFQPRQDFDEEKLKELSDSIKQRGILQPITVKRQKDGDKYVLISGERRVRAARKAGLLKVPAYIYKLEDDSRENLLELALIENIQRDDLNPMELSDSFQDLVDECRLTQEEIAEKVSKSRSTVANYLRLQKLPAEIKSSLRKNEISEAHARTLLRLNSLEEQLSLWKKIISEDISVRKLEELTQKHTKPKKKKEKRAEKTVNPYFEDLENKLRIFFGTRVYIKSKTKDTGEIIIEYFSNDDLERIMDLTIK